MNCRTFSKSLKDYITEELSQEATEMMSRHINKCDKCKALYNSELKTYEFLQSMSKTSNSLFISSRSDIMSNIDKTKYNKTFTNKVHFFMKKNSFKYALGTAAAAALILTLSFSGGHFKDSKIAGFLPIKGGSTTVDKVKKVTPATNTTQPQNPIENKPQDKNQENAMPKKYEDIKYENKELGFSFLIPENWSGKYTIKQSAEGLYVYFKPVNAVSEGQGLLFAILNNSLVNANFYDTVGDPRTFEANGVKYIVGGPTDIGFPDDNKEYTNYKMLKNQVRDIVKTIKVIDNSIKYENKNLGFSFTIPASWSGKYAIKETADGIHVYFKPATPGNPDTQGNGFLFGIVKESTVNADHFDTVGQPRTFEANGVKYIVGGPTGVTFSDSDPEWGNFKNISNQVKDVVKTIKVISNNK